MDEKSTEIPNELLDARFDELVAKYGDPLEVLFDIATDKMVPLKDRSTAANHLCSLRYAKKKAEEVELKGPLVPPVLEIIVTERKV